MIATGKWPGNDPLEIPADQAHSPGNFQRLNSYTLPEIEKKLVTYNKLIVVRHPLERLLSAYRNKLEAKHEKSAKYFQSRFGKKIVKVTRKFFSQSSATFHSVFIQMRIYFTLLIQIDDRILFNAIFTEHIPRVTTGYDSLAAREKSSE